MQEQKRDREVAYDGSEAQAQRIINLPCEERHGDKRVRRPRNPVEVVKNASSNM